MHDHFAIRRTIEDWVVWRDSGEWTRLATLWHPEGRMVATWFQAGAADFIARSQEAWRDGMDVVHMLGGSSIDLHGDRAISQTKMQITQRAQVHGVLVDVTCHGRFWDAFERYEGEWKLLLRQPVYDMDRMTPVDPSARINLDRDLLESFPKGYRYLAYLQTQTGAEVDRDLPGPRGLEIERLRERGRRWVDGGSLAE